MEQRAYRGNFTPDSLADYLVQHYNNERHLAAQKISNNGNVLVQIGRPEDHGQSLRNAVSIAIARPPQDEQDILVTLGEQQWLGTNNSAIHAATGSLIGALFTPWALFGLLWPASQALGQHLMPQDIWNNVEFYVAGQGGIQVNTQILTHPHLGQNLQ